MQHYNSSYICFLNLNSRNKFHMSSTVAYIEIIMDFSELYKLNVLTYTISN